MPHGPAPSTHHRHTNLLFLHDYCRYDKIGLHHDERSGVNNRHIQVSVGIVRPYGPTLHKNRDQVYDGASVKSGKVW